MRRLFCGLLAAGAVVMALLAARAKEAAAPPPRQNGELRIQVEERNPWTHLRVDDPAKVFHFAIVSDRTGGLRPGVFAKAVDHLNLLRPAFVLSVGDLIPGFTEEQKQLTAQWRTFQNLVGKLHMPFFFVPGNHDLTNPVQEEHWRKRFGRRYYHFSFRDVLFLILNSDDPPGGDGSLGKEQIAFAKQVLAENRGARWTIVALHRPLWDQGDLNQNGWLHVEQALAGRSYTVFAGHMHRYQKFVRQGMNHYQLATTGGGSLLRGPTHGEFDHFVWVTMSETGPVLANILLDGILPENLTPLMN